jgi:alpha-1,3-rhamnosyl/mannosyltransferase
MRLGVNGWRLGGTRTGIARYLHNLLVRWTPDVVRPRFDAVTVYVPRPLGPAGGGLAPGLAERVLRPEARMLVWENTRFGPTATDDVLFCPSYTRPLWRRGRTVVAIHDAVPALYPHLFGRTQPLYNRLYSWSGRHSELVLTSTAAARDDIARHWGVDADTIRVIPLAADDAFRALDTDDAAARAATALGSAEPYFLFVGKPTGRRRVTLLVEAFAAFKAATGLPHRLVFAGPPLDDEDELLAAASDAVRSIHHAGFVPDDELNVLYNAAAGMVWPSLYEVVSLPIYEAHAAGTPLACVDTRGSRETTGGAALFMPELTIANLVDAFTRLASEPVLRADLRAAGLANAARTSWSRTAEETLDALAGVAAAPAGG